MVWKICPPCVHACRPSSDGEYLSRKGREGGKGGSERERLTCASVCLFPVHEAPPPSGITHFVIKINLSRRDLGRFSVIERGPAASR